MSDDRTGSQLATRTGLPLTSPSVCHGGPFLFARNPPRPPFLTPAFFPPPPRFYADVARQGLEASRRVIQQMSRRASTNKLVMRGIAASILLLFLFLLWPALVVATP